MTVTGFGGTCRQTGNRLIPQRGAPCLLRSQDKTRRVADVAFSGKVGRASEKERRRAKLAEYTLLAVSLLASFLANIHDARKGVLESRSPPVKTRAEDRTVPRDGSGEPARA